MAQTAEELEAQQAKEQEKKEELERKIDSAGTEAGKEVAKQGASDDEVKAAVERARKEEKDKLYPQIKDLKDSIQEIQETVRAEREEKEQIRAEAEAEKEKRRQEKLTDSEKTIEALKKLEEQLSKERAERKQSEEKWELHRKEQALDKYRQSAIEAANGEIIPELVRGSTEEEIDAAVTIAKARYTELAEHFKDKAGEKVRKDMPNATSPSTEALEQEELEKRLTAVDQDKYMKDPEYRERIQNELAGAYARAAGRV